MNMIGPLASPGKEGSMRTISSSASYRHGPSSTKKMRPEAFLATSLLLMLVWEGGFVFLHLATTPIHWLPVLSVISLVLYLLTSSRAA